MPIELLYKNTKTQFKYMYKLCLNLCNVVNEINDMSQVNYRIKLNNHYIYPMLYQLTQMTPEYDCSSIGMIHPQQDLINN